MKKLCMISCILFVTITYAQDKSLDLPAVSPAWRIIIKYSNYSDSTLLKWVKEIKSGYLQYESIADSILLIWVKGSVNGFYQGYDNASIEAPQRVNQSTLRILFKTKQDLHEYYKAMHEDLKMMGKQLGAEQKHHDFAQSIADILTECIEIIIWAEDLVDIYCSILYEEDRRVLVSILDPRIEFFITGLEIKYQYLESILPLCSDYNLIICGERNKERIDELSTIFKALTFK